METNDTTPLIAVKSPPQAFVVSLEGTNLFFTIILSISAFITILIKIVSKFNTVTSELRDLKEDLNNHSNAEGHAKLLEHLKVLQKDLAGLDKNFHVHLQDYINYKDANLLQSNNLNEKINHTWTKAEKLLNERKSEIKEIQGFLQKQQNFKIRE